MVLCDKWVAVKVFEFLFCVSCVVCKRVTDDEAVRVSLYLQKLSREWPLLRNITWSSVGASFGDAVYGGYVIITFGLLLGRIFREIPRGRRVLEGFLLGIGALFFIILGGLELASLESIPERLIDNAAVLGVLSLITAALFLIDLAAPRKKITNKHSQTDAEKNALVYPKLPQENVKDKAKDDASGASKTTIFSDKFKKTNKKDDKKKQKIDKKDISRVEEVQEKETDEIDHFVLPQNDGYHNFGENHSEEGLTFEEIEKSKYGSVRNGDVKMHKQVETFQKMTPNYNQPKESTRDTFDKTPKSQEYEQEMDKNVAYLKLLDEKRRHNEVKQYNENLGKSDEKYMKEYKQNMTLHIENDRRNYPRVLTARSDYEKQKQWETFDEESLPPFSVREDYLPELQTPVFAKVKENKFNKIYGIYDNYNHFNIPNKRTEGSQTDSLRSKTSTLKTKAPTLQQIAEYFGLEHKKPNKAERREVASQVEKDELPAVSFILPMTTIKERREFDYNGAPISPTDPGYVQYTAQNWNEKHDRRHSTRTPRHSPTD